MIKKEIEKGKYAYYTYSDWMKFAEKENRLFDWLLEDIEIIENSKIWEIYPIDNIVDSIISWLHSSGYSDAEIVLIENKYAKDYIEKNEVKEFSNYNVVGKNKIINSFNDEFKKKCSDKLNVIPFIDDTYGDTDHKWGLSPLHMCEDYYLYLKEALESIAKNEWTDNKDNIVSK